MTKTRLIKYLQLALLLTTCTSMLACGASERDPGTSDITSGAPSAGEPQAGGNSAGATPGGVESAELSPCPSGLPWVTIPLRVHLLSSSIDSLNSTMSEARFLETLAEAQVYLDPTCVKVEVEQFIREELGAEREARFREVAQNNPSEVAFRQMMVDVMPTDNLLEPGWNVMVFKAFERYTSGVYLTDLPSVLWAEQLPAMGGGAPNPPLILAHEIGHSLGLLHYEGPNLERNLMCQAVMQNQETATELTEEQVSVARAQAETGRTFLPAP